MSKEDDRAFSIAKESCVVVNGIIVLGCRGRMML